MNEINGLIPLCISGTTYHAGYGKIPISPEELDEGVAAFNALPAVERRLPIRYGSHEIDSDAAGWIQGLVSLTIGAVRHVFALVDWNDNGAGAVKEKRQLFISPEFAKATIDTKTGGKTGFRFLGAALLNDPHLTAMGPAVAFGTDLTYDSILLQCSKDQTNLVAFGSYQGQTMAGENETDLHPAPSSDDALKMRKRLAAAIGSPEDSDDDALFARIAELMEAHKAADAELCKMDQAANPELLSGGKLSAAQAVIAFGAVKSEKIALTSKIAELETQLGAATAAATKAEGEKLEAEAVAAVERVILSRKATPAERPHLLAQYKAGPEIALAAWGARKEVIGTGATGVGEPEPTGNADDREVASINKHLAAGKSAADAFALAAQGK